METFNQITVVKFDKGFYADKQPNLDYAFTDDVSKARQFATERSAVVILNCGLELGMKLPNYPLRGEVETYQVHCIITKI